MLMAFLHVAIPAAVVWLMMMLSPLLTRRDVFFSVVRSTGIPRHRRGQGCHPAPLPAGGHGPVRDRPRHRLALVEPPGPKLPWALDRRCRPRGVSAVLSGASSHPAPRRCIFDSPRGELAFESRGGAGRYRLGACPFSRSRGDRDTYLLEPLVGDPRLRFPIHLHDIAGTPNGWADRTLGGVLGVLLVQALALGAAGRGASDCTPRPPSPRDRSLAAEEDLRGLRRDRCHE